MTASRVNKRDNTGDILTEPHEPHNPGSGDFTVALLAYGYGMGDPSDVATLYTVFEEPEDEDEDTTNAVATGKLNVGKLLSTN